MVYIRSLIFNIICYLSLLVICAIGTIIGIFSSKVERFFINSMGLPFIRWCLYLICGLKIEIRGKENISKEGILYGCKHQSAMETYFLTSYVKNSTFIFKKELTYIPFFGWAVYFYGSVPVNRSGGSGAMKQMLRDTKKLMDKNYSITIFPEGTRTQPGQTVEYKPGIAFLYQNLNKPVVPVALNTGFFWKKKSFLRYPGKVIIEFMPAIQPGLEKREFVNKLQNVIEEKCAKLNAETIKNFPETKIMLSGSKGKS